MINWLFSTSICIMTITAITTTRTSSLTSTTSTRPTLTSSASLERVLSKRQKAASDHLTRGKAMGLGPVKRRIFKELQHWCCSTMQNLTQIWQWPKQYSGLPGSMPAPKSNIWWSHRATRSWSREHPCKSWAACSVLSKLMCLRACTNLAAYSYNMCCPVMLW